MRLLVSCYLLGGKKVDVEELIENRGFSGLKEKERSMIHDFTYLKPNTLQEALAMLADHKDECKIICGGQSLLIVMRQGLVVTDFLIDIKRLNELSYINYDEREGLQNRRYHNPQGRRDIRTYQAKISRPRRARKETCLYPGSKLGHGCWQPRSW